VTDVSGYHICPMFKDGVRNDSNLKMGPTGSLTLKDGTVLFRKSLTKYQHTPRNIQRERRPQLHRGRSLRSRVYFPSFRKNKKFASISTIHLSIKWTSYIEFILNSLFPVSQTAIHLHNPSLRVICKTRFIKQGLSSCNHGQVKYYLLRSKRYVNISDHAQRTNILSKTKNTSPDREITVSVP
jgi:hypothetical protein